VALNLDPQATRKAILGRKEAYDTKMQKRAEVRMAPEERQGFERTLEAAPEEPVQFIPLPESGNEGMQ
jgi:hypothetical protein